MVLPRWTAAGKDGEERKKMMTMTRSRTGYGREEAAQELKRTWIRLAGRRTGNPCVVGLSGLGANWRWGRGWGLCTSDSEL